MKSFLETIVVPCAGRGARLGNAESKCLAPLLGKPLLQHVVDFWKSRARLFIFVAPPGDKALRDWVSTLHAPCAIVEQHDARGSGHAVLCAEPLVTDRFTVVLGDCILKGRWLAPRDMSRGGIGIWRDARPEDISANFGVQIEHSRIRRVIEKPSDPAGLACGMGVYFFTKEIFDAIRATLPDKAGEIQITDALQCWIDRNGAPEPVGFEGFYANINRPEDLARAQARLSA